MQTETTKSKKAKVKEPEAPKARVVGTAVTKPLDSVKPNDWNPNAMTPFEEESLKYGLVHDGWLASQALLIWGTDEKGRKKNIIIDGEHRWTAATELEIKEGPMVFLERLPEVQAKALTVKMNAKRGRNEEIALGELLRSIQNELDTGNFALDLGIEEEKMMVLLAEPDIMVPTDDPDPVVGPEGSTAGIPSSDVKMVQLFFNEASHAEFTEAVRRLATKFGTKNVTDTTLEAIRRASRATKDKG